VRQKNLQKAIEVVDDPKCDDCASEVLAKKRRKSHERISLCKRGWGLCTLGTSEYCVPNLAALCHDKWSID
jgi:hypothetical protein